MEKHGVKIDPRDVTDETKKVDAVTSDGLRSSCRVLPMSTMGYGYVSDQTVDTVKALRAKGVLFIIVTAARKSTLHERLPLLPPADVAVAECGTRIYHGGRLDADWAARFEAVSGPLETSVPPAERPQPLWDLYRRMQAAGVRVDARSYYGCFRADTQGDPEKQRVVEGFVNSLPGTGIASNMNLGKYDFFPEVCGKGNAVRYLQRLYGLTKDECVALFDDDNDIEMAQACGGGHYLPSLTSASIVKAVKENPSWEVAERAGQGVFAIEEILRRILATVEAGARQAARPSGPVAERPAP